MTGTQPLPAARDDARLLRTLFDQLPALIAYWDRDARNVVANAAYVEWFGFRPEEMVGLHISEVLGDEVYAKNLPYIEAALAGEEQLFDRTLIDQAGRVRHTQASYVPDVVDGDVQGFFVLVTDVTPRVEAQRDMAEAQAIAQVGSWSFDPRTGSVQWSDELFRIVGAEPGGLDLEVESLSELVHPDDRSDVLDNLARASALGQPYTIHYRLVRRDGAVREVVSRGRPTRGPTGEVVRITGTLQDVTEGNEAARELARTNAELRRASELNADLMATLGHDIRTPVTSVIGFLELLETGWDDLAEDQRRQMVSRTRQAAVRVHRMMDALLSLAAADSGRLVTRPQDIGAAEHVRDLVSDLGWVDRVEVRCEGVSPRCWFDPTHLTQVVTNLLSNALRYGRPPVVVTIGAEEGRTTIAVSDGGDGVPADQVGTLFQRFQRTGRAQTDAGGSGFGLYMSARLAAANDGTVSYDPGPPHRFVLRAPATAPTP